MSDLTREVAAALTFLHKDINDSLFKVVVENGELRVGDHISHNGEYTKSETNYVGRIEEIRVGGNPFAKVDRVPADSVVTILVETLGGHRHDLQQIAKIYTSREPRRVELHTDLVHKAVVLKYIDTDPTHPMDNYVALDMVSGGYPYRNNLEHAEKFRNLDDAIQYAGVDIGEQYVPVEVTYLITEKVLDY